MSVLAKRVVAYCSLSLFIVAFIFLGLSTLVSGSAASTQSAPTKLDTLSRFGGAVTNVSVYGNIAVAYSSNSGLHLLDVSTPQMPIHLAGTPSDLGINPYITDAAVGPSQLAVTDDNGLHIFDITDRTTPEEVYTEAIQTENMMFVGNLLIGERPGDPWTHDDNELFIYDLSDPEYPQILDSMMINVVDMIEINSLLYVINDDQLRIIDISDPASIVQISEFTEPMTVSFVEISGYGTQLYVYQRNTRNEHGVLLIDVVDSTEPTSNGFFPLTRQNTTQAASKMAAYEDKLITYDGSTKNILLIDTEVPENPVQIDSLYVERGSSLVFDSELVFATTHNYGLRIFAAPLDDNLEQIGSYSATGTGDLIVDQDMVYVVSRPNIIQILEIGSDLSLSEISQLILPGDSIGEIAKAHDVLYVANENAGLQIVSIADRTNPYIIAAFPLSNATQVHVQDSLAFVINDSIEMYIIDISDPDNPNQVSVHQVADNWLDAFDVSGNYAYLGLNIQWDANFVQILDISNPSFPTEVKFLSTGAFGLDAVDVEHNLLITQGTYAIEMFDITDPENPSFIGERRSTLGYISMHLFDGLVYCNNSSYPLPPYRNQSKLRVIQVDENPEEIGISTDAMSILDMDIANDVAFASSFANGIYVLGDSDTLATMTPTPTQTSIPPTPTLTETSTPPTPIPTETSIPPTPTATQAPEPSDFRLYMPLLTRD
jgi:hypothetical protein